MAMELRIVMFLLFSDHVTFDILCAYILLYQDGRTALSVAVTCESESAAKLVTLLIGIIAPPLLVPGF